jgi:hypothetical protein
MTIKPWFARNHYHQIMEKRTDRHTAVYVDLAVNVSAVFGLSAGVQALHEQQVPLPVVQRILIDRGPRRGDQSDRATASRLQA